MGRRRRRCGSGPWRQAAAAKRWRQPWTTGQRRPCLRQRGGGRRTRERKPERPHESTSRLASAFTTASSSAAEPPGTETGSIRLQSERRTRPTSGGLTVSHRHAAGTASAAGTGGGDGREADEATVAAGAGPPVRIDDQAIRVVQRVDAVARDTRRVEHDPRGRIRMTPDPDLPNQVAIVEPERLIGEGGRGAGPADRRKSATVPQCAPREMRRPRLSISMVMRTPSGSGVRRIFVTSEVRRASGRPAAPADRRRGPQLERPTRVAMAADGSAGDKRAWPAAGRAFGPPAR